MTRGARPKPSHLHQLPVIARFCRRTSRACVAVDEMLREEYSEKGLRRHASLPPLIHCQTGREGAGFGAVIQEKANLLWLGLATGRQVLWWTDSLTFNSVSGGSLFSPPGRIGPPLEGGLPPGVGFSTLSECDSFISGSKTLLPYKCISLPVAPKPPVRHTYQKWLPRLEDGMAMDYIDILKKKKIWDRWAHKRIREELDPGELFPNQTAVVFGSPSITLAFIQDMLLKRKPESGLSAAYCCLSRRGEGPNCLVRHMLRRAAVQLRTPWRRLDRSHITTE